jgi:N-acetylglutamate synthase
VRFRLSHDHDSLLGRRVVLRQRVGVRDGRVVYTDVLGELTRAADVFSVRRADGSMVDVPADDVHRLKAVTPGAAEILALEEVAAAGWPAPETARLGAWLLRSAEGWTRRGNSALLLGDPGVPLAEALDHVRDWYARRGRPAILAIPMPAQAAANRMAARLGWVADVETDVLTAPLAGLAADDPGVRIEPDLTPEWEAVYRAKTVPAVGRRILTGPDTVGFASVRAGGGTVAIGRGVVVGGWLGVAAVEVLPEHRRQGLAGRVMAALARWGLEHGARRCYLQVESANAPAHALYERLGFERHHRYLNRRASG